MIEMETARTPLSRTVSVWKALFLREAVFRLFGSRAAWVWLLLEPIVHTLFLVTIFSGVRMRVIGGIQAAVWLMVGLLAFFMFRRTASQALSAVSANQALFAYRQVKPVDTVLTRAGLEGFLMVVITVILVSAAALSGFDVVPRDPLLVFAATLGLWLFGLGFGLVGSVASEMIPEVGKIIGLLMTPIYFLSGVMFAPSSMPQQFRELLMLNPIVHGLEAARLGFAPFYDAADEVSLSYLYACALGAIFCGLALHQRFAAKLAAK